MAAVLDDHCCDGHNAHNQKYRKEDYGYDQYRHNLTSASIVLRPQTYVRDRCHRFR